MNRKSLLIIAGAVGFSILGATTVGLSLAGNQPTITPSPTPAVVASDAPEPSQTPIVTPTPSPAVSPAPVTVNDRLSDHEQRIKALETAAPSPVAAPSATPAPSPTPVLPVLSDHGCDHYTGPTCLSN